MSPKGRKVRETATERAHAAVARAQPPETYHITVTVQTGGNDGAKLTVDMPVILRSDILAADYPSKGIQAAVWQFEYMVYGIKVPAKEGDPS
jgi:hypothetical protein